MRERPIPFSGPMVQALLEGRKFQTRRVVRGTAAEWLAPGMFTPDFVAAPANGLSPYGYAGDRLWVREAWRVPQSLDKDSGRKIADRCMDAGYREPWCPVQYEVDGARNSEKDWREFGSTPGEAVPGRYRHARFMPRWAARILLEVAEVRIERLQDLTERDAVAEGVKPVAGGICGDDDLMVPIIMSAHDMRHIDQPMMPAPIARFILLWDGINGKRPGETYWNANPWVWVVSFQRLEVP